MESYKISISGKVQGVFFRAYTEEKARAMGIHGTVKNEPNGSVSIEAEGEENTLKEFIAWCHKGSPFSKVDKVEIEKRPLRHFQDFIIIR